MLRTSDFVRPSDVLDPDRHPAKLRVFRGEPGDAESAVLIDISAAALSVGLVLLATTVFVWSGRTA